MADSEPRYTLAEAAAELRRRECTTHGHEWQTISTLGHELPTRLVCDRCGLSATVQPDNGTTT